jgi:hypothetical protein
VVRIGAGEVFVYPSGFASQDHAVVWSGGQSDSYWKAEAKVVVALRTRLIPYLSRMTLRIEGYRREATRN